MEKDIYFHKQQADFFFEAFLRQIRQKIDEQNQPGGYEHPSYKKLRDEQKK